MNTKPYYTKWLLIHKVLKRKFFNNIIHDFKMLDNEMKEELREFWNKSEIDKEDLVYTSNYSYSFIGLCLMLLILKEKGCEDLITVNENLVDLAGIIEMNPSLMYFLELKSCNNVRKFKDFVSDYSRKGITLNIYTPNFDFLEMLLNSDFPDEFLITNEDYLVFKKRWSFDDDQEENEFNNDDSFNSPLIITDSDIEDADQEEDGNSDNDSIEIARRAEDVDDLSVHSDDNMPMLNWNDNVVSKDNVQPLEDLPPIGESIVDVDMGSLNTSVDSIDLGVEPIQQEEEVEEMVDSESEPVAPSTTVFLDYLNNDGVLEESVFESIDMKDTEEDDVDDECLLMYDSLKDDCNNPHDGIFSIWSNIKFSKELPTRITVVGIKSKYFK